MIEFYRSARSVLVTFTVAFVLIHLSGCSAYQNFTGYFNTYYNADKLYSEALAEIEKTVPAGRDTNYFARYVIPPNAKTKLDKVIEKCSRLIHDYPEIGWVQDAIMMIGRSYVYIGDFEPAKRKFNELITNFPESDLRFEAKLLRAKADYYSKRDDEALATLKELFPEARNEGKDEIMLETLMLEAQIYFDRGEYEQAAATNGLAIEVSGDDRMKAFARYQTGLSYERLKNNEKAAQAFGSVGAFDPDPTLIFQARLRYGTMLAAIGQHDQALNVLEELMDEQLKPEEYGLVELEIANTFWAMGDSAQAFSLYDLIDSTYKRTDAAAKSYYRRGKIYEDVYGNLTVAGDFYDRARVEFPSSEIYQAANRRASSLQHYKTTWKEIIKNDSLLKAALRADSLQRLDSLKQDSLHASDSTSNGTSKQLASIDPLAAAEAGRQRSDSARAAADSAKPEMMRPPDAPGDAQAILPDELDSLAGRPLIGPDDQLPQAHLIQKQLAPPHADTLRRAPSDTVKTGAVKTDSVKTRNLATQRADSAAQKKPPVPTTPPPKTVSPDQFREELAKRIYELAGLHFLELDRPDSALYWYERIDNYSPKSPFIPKALYARAEILRVKGDSLGADSLYNIILDRYDSTSYGFQVRKTLGMDTTNVRADLAVDLFAESERLLEQGKPAESILLLKDMHDKFKGATILPKVQYTVGWIYENVLDQTDSATAWYKKLLKEYPQSIFAANVQGKVAVHDDPKSIDKYVKIQEIQAVAKPVKPNAVNRNAPPGRDATRPDTRDPRSIRDADRDDEEEMPMDEDSTDEGEDQPSEDEGDDEGDDDGGQ